MKILLVFFLLVSSPLALSNPFAAQNSSVAKSVITGLAPSEIDEHYILLSVGEYDEVRIDCSSFLNHLYFQKGDQQKSFYLFHEECFYLAQKAYDAGIDNKPFCLEADQNNPPFQIFDDPSFCRD